jgi:hypothetical protein
MDNYYSYCSRCTRHPPPSFIGDGWEIANLGTIDQTFTADKIVWVCPDCLTSEEVAAINDDLRKLGFTHAQDDPESRLGTGQAQ